MVTRRHVHVTLYVSCSGVEGGWWGGEGNLRQVTCGCWRKHLRHTAIGVCTSAFEITSFKSHLREPRGNSKKDLKARILGARGDLRTRQESSIVSARTYSVTAVTAIQSASVASNSSWAVIKNNTIKNNIHNVQPIRIEKFTKCADIRNQGSRVVYLSGNESPTIS
jgi:hypothetical protein